MYGALDGTSSLAVHQRHAMMHSTLIVSRCWAAKLQELCPVFLTNERNPMEANLVEA